ncbi:hypothetical protein Tco_0397802 [Tanacetum coccineum]
MNLSRFRPGNCYGEHEDYINRMSLLCGNSSSRSPKNSHIIIESLPMSTTLIEDNDPVQEEIDLFPGPDDLIPPGVENDDSEDEDNSTFFLENSSSILDPFIPRPLQNHRMFVQIKQKSQENGQNRTRGHETGKESQESEEL